MNFNYSKHCDSVRIRSFIVEYSIEYVPRVNIDSFGESQYISTEICFLRVFLKTQKREENNFFKERKEQKEVHEHIYILFLEESIFDPRQKEK
jgi:hypothetical protein